jgi:hypothetical protein
MGIDSPQIVLSELVMRGGRLTPVGREKPVRAYTVSSRGIAYAYGIAVLVVLEIHESMGMLRITPVVVIDCLEHASLSFQSLINV